MLPGFRSMDDALLVGVAEPVADLLHHVELVVERQLSLGCDDVLEIVALQELHRHEELAVVLAELVHGHDVRVVELSRRLRLAHESRPKHVFLIQGRGDELDRHVAVQHRVVTSVDGAHRAAAQPVDDRVLPDFGGLVRASGGGLGHRSVDRSTLTSRPARRFASLTPPLYGEGPGEPALPAHGADRGGFPATRTPRGCRSNSLEAKPVPASSSAPSRSGAARRAAWRGTPPREAVADEDLVGEAEAHDASFHSPAPSSRSLGTLW